MQYTQLGLSINCSVLCMSDCYQGWSLKISYMILLDSLKHAIRANTVLW